MLILWQAGALISQMIVFFWMPSQSNQQYTDRPAFKEMAADKPMPASHFQAILDQNIFNAARGKLNQAKAGSSRINAGAKFKKILNGLQLNGIVIWGEYRFALIADKKNGREKQFNPGDQVFKSGVIVHSVEQEKVFLKMGAEIGFLEKMVNKDAVTLKKDTPGSKKAVSQSAIQQQGQDFYIPSAEIEASMNDFSKLINQARVVAYFKKGVHQGYKIRSIDKGSLYDKIGLKNNDIIKKVNGNAINSTAEAMRLFQVLRNEKEITLQLERGGKPFNFQYHIQ